MTTIENPIAERRYAVDGELQREIVVRIGAPAPDPLGDWLCPFHVDGLQDAPEDAHGIDAIQAIEIALEAARKTIEQAGLNVFWFAGDDTGISRQVPSYLPKFLRAEIGRYIDGQLEEFGRLARAKAAWILRRTGDRQGRGAMFATAPQVERFSSPWRHGTFSTGPAAKVVIPAGHAACCTGSHENSNHRSTVHACIMLGHRARAGVHPGHSHRARRHPVHVAEGAADGA